MGMERSKWQKVIYDVEVYPNCFLCAIQDVDTKEKIVWEISDRINEYDEVVKFFKGFNQYLISFNGIHYDNCIMLYIIHNKIDNVDNYLQKLKEWSDYIINNEFWWNNSELKKYKYQNQWIDIDLYLYWSKMLRLSKKISLKGLAIQLNYPVVQELPFDPAISLNHTQIDELRHYNSVHDLGITQMLYDAMLSDVKLRQYISTTYDLKCYSWDAPKMASELLLKEYCKLTHQDPKYVRSLKFEHKNKLELPKINFQLDCFKELYDGMSNSLNEFSKEIVLLHNNTKLKLTYGKGGLHSVNKNESYFETEDTCIITSDVASLYPNLIINYGLLRQPEVLNLYTKVKADRIDAKKNKDKSKDALLKLILNSTSGMIDNQYSWLYYPEGAMKLRLMGQLILTLTIERLVLANYEVISANTDGIEVIVPKNKTQQYYNIVNQVGKEFNLEFEHEFYKKIIYQNVNNYLAQTESKLKQKGLFVEKPELGNSVDYLIIPKALKAYYIDNIPVKQFVESHNDIFDFCCSQKVDKSYDVMWTNPQFVTSKQQRLNRFYASTKGGYIYKCRNGKQAHLLKQSGVMIYNNHNPDVFPTDINYKFYISQINEIISEIDNKNQLTLF
jgi:hypothetical protein